MMPNPAEKRVAVLMAVHNRRPKTVACLRAIKERLGESGDLGLQCELYLFDDGSHDGSADAVREIWPDARIIRGDGTFFWCRGMNAVWKEAAKADPDYYLLLNDDTMMIAGGMRTLIQALGDERNPAIAVGLVINPETRLKTYGVTYSSPPKPGAGRPAEGESPMFNANCVLVPRAVYQRLGTFHPAYTHSMGDTDYSHAATRQGVRIVETDRPVATCERNPVAGTWKDLSLSRWERFRKLNSPKGLPYGEWWIFCGRNCGKSRLRYFLSPTFRILMGR